MDNVNDTGLWPLLEPISKAAFLSEYWEKCWLHLRGVASAATSKLLSLADLEQLLFDVSGSKHAIYAVGDRLNTEGPDRSVTSDDPVNAWFRGRTLVFQDLDRRLPRLSSFTRRLEADLSHRLRCHVYLTPPQSKGFSAHYDPHDVFVLQLIGSKKWRIGDKVVQSPLRDQIPDGKSFEISNDLEIAMQPGDLLYIPGGWLHEATSGSDISCHLTFGLVANTYLDFIVAAVTAAARRDPEFRRQLAPGTEPSTSTALNLIARIGLHDLDEAALALLKKDAIEQPRPTQDLLGLAKNIMQISENDHFQASGSLRPYLRSMRDTIELYVYGKRIALPKRLEPALRYCLRMTAFSVASIPGEIELADKIYLVRRLLIEGILVRFEAR